MESTSESQLNWIPVNSDEECIPRMRRISSSTSSSEDTESIASTSNGEKSTNDNDSSFASPANKMQIKSMKKRKGPINTSWQKEPLSIMWCLNSFDDKSPAENRSLVFDQKTVMAFDKVQDPDISDEDDEDKVAVELLGPGSNKKKKKKKTKKKKNRGKVSSSAVGGGATHKKEEDYCLSCDSIDSSPTSYRDDKIWTGYKLKRKERKRSSLGKKGS